MKTIAALLLTTTTLLSAPSTAHVEFNGQCNIELQGHINYAQGQMIITTADDTEIRITETHQLYVNQQPIALDSEQQQWLADYYENIEIAIPKTLSIAMQGIDIANEAVTEVFAELLGSDHRLIEEFSTTFSELTTEIEQRFYSEDGNYQFNSQALSDNWGGDNWETAFESRLEAVIERSMGAIIMAVGREMFSGDGNIEEFAARMDNLGDTIESRVEGRTEDLEVKADELCAVLTRADYAERKLQRNIAELANLNLLEVDGAQMLK